MRVISAFICHHKQSWGTAVCLQVGFLPRFNVFQLPVDTHPSDGFPEAPQQARHRGPSLRSRPGSQESGLPPFLHQGPSRPPRSQPSTSSRASVRQGSAVCCLSFAHPAGDADSRICAHTHPPPEIVYKAGHTSCIVSKSPQVSKQSVGRPLGTTRFWAYNGP